MNFHEEWVEQVVSECGAEIREFNPETQAAMPFHREPWLRWNESDADLVHLLDDYPNGIRRRDLKKLARGLKTPHERRVAFIATLVWGAGKTNRYYGRHADALRSIDLERILEVSARQVRDNDLEGAWVTAAGIPGLDFRFFTKWLWLAGASAELPAPPLVYDQRVRDSLVKASWPSDRRRINNRRRWVNYCQDAAAVAGTLSGEPSAPTVTSEWVEYWLFSGAPGAERVRLS
ncbi:hypothetical protein [Mycolicibacterium sp.]|uniref:8-oxoguanine DNA glycosylase OGG fold protein n=1 Tax=Mycolicibacterium sp. TaxID=2320850 RepID=UPI0025F5D83A|nr:hypothetical protein [Mycolicibacterium sp.]MCB9410790.1 hypothetical protein [Mycolicibacterium sp.]